MLVAGRRPDADLRQKVDVPRRRMKDNDREKELEHGGKGHA